jgi:cytidine diphosphoramidate kinase
MITWLIGMSGSGKTTLGSALYEHFKPSVPNLVFLDGDNFREIFRNDVDHTIEGRRKNAERISHFSKVLDDQNIHVIAAVLSIFPEWQEWNRNNFSQYFEIFLDVQMEELERRDTKSLYKKARNSLMDNVVGIDIEFPRPAKSNLIIDGYAQSVSVEFCLNLILKKIPPFK